MKRILFLDDDPTIQEVVHLILDDEYLVETVSDATPLLKNEFSPPDLFLLDKQLKGADGLEICRFLKSQEHTRRIPVVIISASPNITQLAKEAGADEVIEKPFPIRDLREIISNCLAMNV